MDSATFPTPMQSRVFKRVYPADSEQNRQFLLVTLINMLLPDNPQSKKVVAVGPVSPPILAEKIWHRNTLSWISCYWHAWVLLAQQCWMCCCRGEKAKQKKMNITTIEEWVMSFNNFISVVAVHTPDSVRDLLAYSSTIVKASQDF